MIWQLVSVAYSKGRKDCWVTMRATRPPGRFRRWLKRGPTSQTAELFSMNYGRDWHYGMLDDPTPEMLAVANAAYRWMPKPKGDNA